MYRSILLFLFTSVLTHPAVFAQQNPDGRLPLANMAEPLALLIRDPYIQSTLKVTETQRQKIRQLTDELDGDLWTTRNQPPEKVDEIMSRVTGLAEARMAKILDAKQLRRLAQIRIWIRGIRGLTDPLSRVNSKLTDDQTKQIGELTDSTREAIAKLQAEAQAGGDIAALQKKSEELNSKMQKDLAALLTDEQKRLWRNILGEPLDAKRLGYVDFLAPSFPTLDQWINSPPLTSDAFKGKVVALHFFAFGCINCIHNYPSYRRWQTQFDGQPFVMLGVHTPETEPERSFEELKKRVATEKLTFPIVMDGQSQLWNAWGNAMWPSVYLIDKQGRVRYWWLGELNWQGAEGERLLGQRIEELLAETP